jgi:putative phosphoesterase
MVIGIISDTHGSLNRQASDTLAGVDHIIHAGDVGAPDIIDALERIAPVTAVRGNTDGGCLAQQLPAVNMVTLSGITFYVLHDILTLDLDPVAAGVQVVVSGHTHRAEIKTTDAILYINPGSASQSRNGAGLSLARIHISRSGLKPEIVYLKA